jgi:hypothetical protein
MGMAESEDTQGNKELLLQALEHTRGMVASAAEKIGISRSIVYVWQKNDPEFKKKIREIKKHIPELMEERLVISGYGGNYKAMVYYLERNHPKYRKKVIGTRADIYHHVEGRNPKKEGSGKTLEEQLYEIAAKRKSDAEENGQP